MSCCERVSEMAEMSARALFYFSLANLKFFFMSQPLNIEHFFCILLVHDRVSVVNYCHFVVFHICVYVCEWCVVEQKFGMQKRSVCHYTLQASGPVLYVLYEI